MSQLYEIHTRSNHFSRMDKKYAWKEIPFGIQKFNSSTIHLLKSIWLICSTIVLTIKRRQLDKVDGKGEKFEFSWICPGILEFP